MENVLFKQQLPYDEYVKQISVIFPKNDKSSTWLFNHHAAQIAWEQNKIPQAKKHIKTAMENNIIGNSLTNIYDFIINNRGTKNDLKREIEQTVYDKIEKKGAIEILNSPIWGKKLNEQDEDWDVDVSDEWNVKYLTVGDKLTPEMFQDSGFSATHYTGVMNDATIIRYSNDGIKDYVGIEFINSIGMKTRSLFYVDILNEKVLKPQYRIVPPLNEQDEEWDIEVSDNWNKKELKVGDLFNTHRGKIYLNQDEIPDSEKNLTYKIIYIGPNEGEYYKPGYLDRDIIVIQSLLTKSNFPFPIDYFNNEYGPKLNAYIPNNNDLNEQDEDWDIEVDDKWGIKDLGIGDYITPEMLSDNAFNKFWRALNQDIKIVGFKHNTMIGDIFIAKYIGSNGKPRRDDISIESFNQYFLKPQYRIVPPLNEQDEDWNVDVDSKWNLSPEEELLLNRYKGKWEETDKGLIVKGSLMLTNTKIKSLGRLYSVEENLEIGYTLESLGNLTNVGGYLLLNFTKIKSLENLQFVGKNLYLFNSKIESFGNLKYVGGNLDLRNTPLSKKYTEEQIRQMINIKGKILGAKPSLNEILESENDWDVNVSDMWSGKELGIGDEITLDMVNKDNQNDYDYFLHNFGPRTFPILIGKSSAGEEYVTLKAVNSKSGKVREFPISWLNDRFLKPQYRIVPSLDEYDTWNYI